VNDGKGLIPFIEWAQQSLFLTNFTPQTYDPAYIEAHQAALGRGVESTRVVRISPEHLDSLAWLCAFFDKKSGKPIGKYKQYHYPEADHARLDLAIIDETYIIEIRWCPFDTHGQDVGRQDMFFAEKNPERAKFRAESWDQHIQSNRLKQIETLDAFKELLKEARQSHPPGNKGSINVHSFVEQVIKS